MPNETFYRNLTDALAKSYPETDLAHPFRERISPTLVSPHILELPRGICDQASAVVTAFFRLRENSIWQSHIAGRLPPVPDPGNTSALMSYDFHIDSDQNLRLIEINTNASLSLVVDELHRVQKIENVFSADFRKEILATFEREMADAVLQKARSSGVATGMAIEVAIVDENPAAQKLFIEFVMYQELFKSRGWRARFFDARELRFIAGKLSAQADPESIPIDLVYNRDTDFYFSNPEAVCLREAMMAKSVTITPHPHEYRLLADKDRLLELSDDTFLDSLSLSDADRAVIAASRIKTIEVKQQDPDELWINRKRYFFKPRRSHGGKAVYRGSSTSRGTFKAILAADYLAQEIIPPPLVKFASEDEEFKYDLRFYVYRDKIQLACARLYRGQMTNSQTPGGGVAPIRWI